MNKYRFDFSIKPSTTPEWVFPILPFTVVLRGSTPALTVSAHESDEQKLRELADDAADDAADDVARGLSFEHSERFAVASRGSDAVLPRGG
jgi:hypothetical protein